MKNNVFTKDKILWQCTIVKFRNNLLGLAVNDKISKDDFDGDEVFMVYNPDAKSFIGQQRLCCYDDNLRNTLDTYIHDIINKKETDKIQSSSSDWDVIAVNKYLYALEAFRNLTSQKIEFWDFNINK